ncbi:hypothetical protein D7Y13_44325, partial [Corallococcus praedator]
MSTTLAEPQAATRSAEQAIAPLARQLAAADRVLQREKGASLVLSAWPWLLAYAVAAICVDVVMHLAAGP